MDKNKAEQLRKLLVPLIHAEESRIDSFLEDDMEGFIGMVIAFQIEEQTIKYLRAHPYATVQELYNLIPEGLPPDDDGADLLEDEE